MTIQGLRKYVRRVCAKALLEHTIQSSFYIMYPVMMPNNTLLEYYNKERMWLWQKKYLVLQHDSSTMIKDGFISHKGRNNYSSNSDLGNYFWGSKRKGQDPSNGKSNTYYSIVPIEDIYNMTTNRKKYGTVKESFVLVRWGDGALCVVSQNPTPIDYIYHEDTSHSDFSSYPSGVYDGQWHFLRSGSKYELYGNGARHNAYLAKKLRPYRDVEVPSFLSKGSYSYKDMIKGLPEAYLEYIEGDGDMDDDYDVPTFF